MEPIISPMWIYWIQTGHALKMFLQAIILMTIFFMVLAIYITYVEKDIVPIKYIITFITSVLLFGMTLFIPSKETMYMMLVAKNITPNTLQSTKTNVKEVVDYIFDKIEEISNKKE